MNMKKINILGTEYTVLICTMDERPKLKKCDGYMDFSIKEIVVGTFEKAEDGIENLEDYTKKVIRHEIIHAFLYESGLWENSGDVEKWGQNETITDWIAMQFPKLLKAFEYADAL